MAEELEKIQKDVRTLPQKIWNTVGVSTAVFLSFYISSLLGLIPDELWEGSFIFLGLPFLFIFIMGIILDSPNFSVRSRWGLGAYLIVSLIAFFFLFGSTDSITQNAKLLLQYVVGVTIVFISAFFYVVPERIMKRRSYRTRAIISFTLSVLITLGYVLLLKRFDIIDFIT